MVWTYIDTTKVFNQTLVVLNLTPKFLQCIIHVVCDDECACVCMFVCLTCVQSHKCVFVYAVEWNEKQRKNPKIKLNNKFNIFEQDLIYMAVIHQCKRNKHNLNIFEKCTSSLSNKMEFSTWQMKIGMT